MRVGVYVLLGMRVCVVRYVCVCVRFIFFDGTFCLKIILQPIVLKSCQIVRFKTHSNTKCLL